MIYVEDLIFRLCGAGKWLFDPPVMPDSGWEWEFVSSLSEQLGAGNAMTEKQAITAIKIIDKYKFELEKKIGRLIDLNNLAFKQPFRILSEDKSITIGQVDGKESIIVRFPYNPEVIRNINEHVKNSDWQSIQWNTRLQQTVAHWESSKKFWCFALFEENILWIANNLLPNGYTACDRFLELVNDTKNIVNSINDYAPMVIKEDGYYKYKNCVTAIEPLDTSNVIKFLFDAKNYGITAWNDKVDSDYKSVVNSKVTKDLLNHTTPIWIDSTTQPIDAFKDVVKYGGPVLIIIPGGSEIDHTVLWHQMALSFGITNKEMAVLFRTPNQNGGEFNKYVKDNELNNDISDRTKIVFVSTKIPKPLVKSGVKFNTVLNLGFYNQLHFSMSVVLQSATNVVYYTNKQPHGITIGNC
jgi:hypothetical protein